MTQTRVLMMTELVHDSGSDERFQLTEIRVFDDVWIVFEEVRAIFLWMEARRSCVALEPGQAVVTYRTLLLLRGTSLADMNDLALTIFFALPKFGVLLVVEASHKNVSVLAEENGRRGVTFVSQR